MAIDRYDYGTSCSPRSVEQRFVDYFRILTCCLACPAPSSRVRNGLLKFFSSVATRISTKMLKAGEILAALNQNSSTISWTSMCQYYRVIDRRFAGL
jgi:hypothetical protein